MDPIAEAMRLIAENKFSEAEKLLLQEYSIKKKEGADKDFIHSIFTLLQNQIESGKATEKNILHLDKLASLGQLTAGVAHEINNPINFVSANINPLKRNFEELISLMRNEIKMEKTEIEFLINETRQLLNGIEQGSWRTAEIVRGLRNFSRLDSDDLKKVNINEGIKSTIILLQNKLKHQNISLDFKEGKIPDINGYPGQLNQVFMNLISNAIDAISENGKISIATEFVSGKNKKDENDSNIKITIRDTGKGMAEEVKQKIFDPFFTTKEFGKGTGLGLSISYGITERHGGKIEVKSEEGNGTEFIITLPVSLKL